LTGFGSFPQPSQEFVERHKERILVNDAADDDQWMGPHYIRNDISAKLSEIVSANDGVKWALETEPHVLRSSLSFQQVSNAG
jgi:hypothetical protein